MYVYQKLHWNSLAVQWFVLQVLTAKGLNQTWLENSGPASHRKWKSLSCVWLFVTLWTILSMEFSRREYWSG